MGAENHGCRDGDGDDDGWRRLLQMNHTVLLHARVSIIYGISYEGADSDRVLS